MRGYSSFTLLGALTLIGLASGPGCRNLSFESTDQGNSGAGKSAAGATQSDAGAAPSNAGATQAGAAGAISDAGNSDPGGDAGNGTAGSAGGNAGAGVGGGATGSPSMINGSTETVLTPGCIEYTPGYAFTTPRALATNTTADGIPYALSVTNPADNMLSNRWKKATNDNAEWYPWQCFGFVPHPQQIAAINIADDSPFATPEYYVTTSDGQLYVRRLYKHLSWGPWLALALPRTDSNLTDIAASSTVATLPFVYVLDRGKIFVRHHLAVQSYSDYSGWSEVPGAPDSVSHLCAAATTDGRQQVFVSTTLGAVFVSTQTNAGVSDPFGSFQIVGDATSPPMTDIDCGYLADGRVSVFGLTSGRVWSHAATDLASLWAVEPASAGPLLKIFAVGSRPGAVPTVFGFDALNDIWWHPLGSTSWTPLD